MPTIFCTIQIRLQCDFYASLMLVIAGWIIFLFAVSLFVCFSHEKATVLRYILNEPARA